jgi:hypothetical protein
LVSASHCTRPRIGSLDRVTCTSTRGGSYHPPGIVPSQPPGSGPPLPCRVLRDRPVPASAGIGHRVGPRAAGPPSGVPSWDASVGRPRPISPSGEGRPNLPIGGWCLPAFIRTQAWRTRSYLRPRPVTGPGSSGPDTRSRFGGSCRHLPFVRPRQRVWPRPLPEPSTGRQVAVQRTGLGRSSELDPTSAGLGTTRPRPETSSASNGRRLGAPCPRMAPPFATSVALDCHTPAWKIDGQ